MYHLILSENATEANLISMPRMLPELTHFFLMFPCYPAPGKRKPWFSDVFRGDENRTLGKSGSTKRPLVFQFSLAYFQLENMKCVKSISDYLLVEISTVN